MISNLSLRVTVEHWPLAKAFAISRGSKKEACVIVVELGNGIHKGRGECVPYPRYNETPETVQMALEAMKKPLGDGLDRRGLQSAMPPGAARNALDCAFWDLEAKQSGRPAYRLAGLSAPEPKLTAWTISLDTPEAMAEAARAAAGNPLLKIKLGREGDAARIAAVRRAVQNAELIVDANEGWTPENLGENFTACKQAGVTLIEQPLPAADDDVLKAIPHPIPLCADESMRDRSSFPSLAGKYEFVNIKLDKSGGLTEALACVDQAGKSGFSVMLGCMVSTSLAVAPALMLMQKACIVDLDGPFLLAKDRVNGLSYENHLIYPPTPELWG